MTKLQPKIERFPPAKQRRLDALLDKNSEGVITPKERTQLKRLVAEAERLMVANAKRLADFSEMHGGSRPDDAVPVTVWVQSEPVSR